MIAEYDSTAVGYAVYYPIFGTFSAIGKIYLEDIFIKEEFRHRGFGRYFLAKIAELAISEGYSAMEWSCLSHNKPSIEFYKKLGAVKESGVEHFKLDKIGLKAVSELAKQPS